MQIDISPRCNVKRARRFDAMRSEEMRRAVHIESVPWLAHDELWRRIAQNVQKKDSRRTKRSKSEGMKTCNVWLGRSILKDSTGGVSQNVVLVQSCARHGLWVLFAVQLTLQLACVCAYVRHNIGNGRSSSSPGQRQGQISTMRRYKAVNPTEY